MGVPRFTFPMKEWRIGTTRVTFSMKQRTMGPKSGTPRPFHWEVNSGAHLFYCAGPVCSLSAKEKARGAALHLPNEGDSALHFLNEGMDDEVHTLRFLNEGADDVAVQSFTEKVKGEAPRPFR